MADPAAATTTPAPELDEALHPAVALRLRQSRLIALHQSSFQQVALYQHPVFGRFFRLDGVLMSTEADEFYYHETLIHPAAQAMPPLRRALVIGGGDGGSARQLLRYASLQTVDVAELDPVVVELARAWLPGVHHQAFDDPRLVLHLGDGGAFLQASAGGYDLIVLDLTDPVGAALPLYQRDFFLLCRQQLAEHGLLSLHLGSPIYQPEQVSALYHRLAGVFAVVRPMLVPIPSYGGLWALAVAGQASDPAACDPIRINQRLSEAGISGLSYYNGDIHQALFAVPEFLRSSLSL